jgi:hypothetical protein
MSQTLKAEADLSADALDLSPDLSPDIDALVIEDDSPVDNLISEKQQRFLTGSPYSNENLLGDRVFLAAANVGVFYAIKQPSLVPRQRAEAAEARATQLAEQLRSLGIDPNL